MQNTPFSSYLNDLLSLGYHSYFDLDASEKDQLTSLYINRSREAEEAFQDIFINSEEMKECLSSLTLYMKNDDVDTKEMMVEKMKLFAVKTYEQELAELFQEKISERNEAEYYSHGFSKRYHVDNGELYWSRY